MLDTETVCSAAGSSDSGSGPPSLQNEFDSIQTMERSAGTDSVRHINQATSPTGAAAATATGVSASGDGGSSGGAPSEPVTPTHVVPQFGEWNCLDFGD